MGEGDEGEAALRRQDLEAIAALALALPAEPAPAALRRRLLASLAGDETQQVPPLTPPQALAAAVEPAAPRPSAAGGPPREVRPARPTAGRAGVPPAPALLAPRLGARDRGEPRGARLAGASALLWRDLAATRERLAESERARAELAAEVAAAEARQASGVETAAELGALREQLAIVTASGTELCAMRPAGARPVAPEAKGLLWVAEDHQHWYLRADGLQPLGQGRVYQLWFLVGDRAVSAGAFELRGDEGVLTSPTMPAGTSAAMVTVEAEGAVRERPSGPVVLYGKEFRKL